MKIVDIATVTRENPKGKRFSKDLFIYHGGWHNEDGNINYRLDSLCVCIVESGTHTSTLNSRDYVVGKGEILVCHPNDFYFNIKFSDDFRATFIYANLDLISSHIPPLEIREMLMKLKSNPVLKPDKETGDMIRSFIHILRTMDSSSGRHTGTTVVLTAKALLIEIFSLIEKEPFNQLSENLTQPALLYQRFIDLLLSLPVKPHDISYYAGELAVTPKYLSFVSKSLSGRTAVEWIREYVMNDAHRYLTCTDLSIKEISTRLGFSNFSFFCQSVRRFWGMSPLKIRNGKQPCENQNTSNQIMNPLQSF